MSQTFLIPKAFCKATNQTVKTQNLSRRFAEHQHIEALQEAQYLADQMCKKTGNQWSPRVESYQLVNNINKL